VLSRPKRRGNLLFAIRGLIGYAIMRLGGAAPLETLKRPQERRQFEDKLIGHQPLTLSEVERSPSPWREPDVRLMPAFLRPFALKAHFASAPQDQHNLTSWRPDTRSERQMPVPCHGACSPEENQMLELTSENFARVLRGLTIAVGNRRNRILLYQFLAAEIRALHCSYGVGDDESYKRARVPGRLRAIYSTQFGPQVGQTPCRDNC
jgi:hypothetical protein